MMENKDPHLFWKGIKSLMPKKHNANKILSKDLVSYFCKLLNINNKGTNNSNEGKQFREYMYIECSLPVIEKEMPLECPIYMKIDIPEISKAITELKKNKATGPDSIFNELLKCKYVDLSNALLHLFNTILNYGKYPEKLMTNIITPIHKSDVNDPQNYRSIAVSNSTNTLFTKIQYKSRLSS